MSLATSPRRDQRRRLVASWKRSASEQQPAAGGDDPPRSGAIPAYDDLARPERHPALATRLPVTVGRLSLAAIAIIATFAGAITLAVCGPLFGRPLLVGGGRFAGTVAVLAAAFDPRATLPVHVWLAVLALFAAAAVAGSVRFMRRHRRDDYKGRFRAWGWLAVILTLAAWSGTVPLGPLVARFMSEATGIAPGPAGIGWWLGLAGCTLAFVIPWAVLSLAERAGTVAWTALAIAVWGTAAAMPWADAWVGGAGRGAIIAQAAWAGGAALMLVAMLTAARAVIREVRGQTPVAPPRAARRRDAAKPVSKPAAKPATKPAESREPAADADDDQADHEATEQDEQRERSADGDSWQADYVDGSEHEHRHLSKAERKRLKKLARMNSHAA